MAVAVTGAAPPAQSTIKTGATSSLHGHEALYLEGPDGRLMLRAVQRNGQACLEICEGGQGSAVIARLWRANVNDSLAALAAFVNTGQLS